MDLGLKGKTAFITGSSKGIGFATARKLLEEGVNVILNSRNGSSLHDAADKLEGDHPGKVQYVAGDMLVADDVKKVISFLMDISCPDIFVANLGSGKPENQNQLDTDELRRFYDINVISNMGILSGIYPLLKKKNNSSVILISSIVAEQVVSAPCGYAAAKSAVITITKYLAHQWADDGIRINCVMPGNILFDGGRWEELKTADPEGVSDYIKRNVPMKRFGKPEEIADAIAFLASERASFITGSVLAVDGGQLGSI